MLQLSNEPKHSLLAALEKDIFDFKVDFILKGFYRSPSFEMAQNIHVRLILAFSSLIILLLAAEEAEAKGGFVGNAIEGAADLPSRTTSVERFVSF